MARRAGKRPWAFEALEARVAMSHPGSTPLGHRAVAAERTHAPVPVRVPSGFGAVGDSLTDEYRFYPPDRSRARNWVEIVAQTRKVDFGGFTTKSRGLPRDQGFANNWALQNSTTTDVVLNQLPGLVAQVKAGKVGYASVNEGSNDFLYFLEATAVALPTAGIPANFAEQSQAVEATAQANFDTTVTTLLAASPNVKVVAATVADLNQIPIISQYLGIPLAQQAVAAVEAQVQVYNAHIRQVATTTPRVALADLAAVGASAAGQSSLPFGPTTLNLTTTGNDYHNFVLADQLHPGTLAQGLIANVVINAADSLGARIKPLSPAEIVQYARNLARHPGSTP